MEDTFSGSDWSRKVNELREHFDAHESDEECGLCEAVEIADVHSLDLVLNRIGPRFDHVAQNRGLREAASFALSRWEDLDLAEKAAVFTLADIVLQVVGTSAVAHAMNEAEYGGGDYEPGGYV